MSEHGGETDLVNVFHCTADNLGDRMSGPCQYLWPDRHVAKPFGPRLRGPLRRVIMGGGQVFAQSAQLAANLIDSNERVGMIGWGIGLPLQGSRDQLVRAATDRFSAFGTRNFDWRDDLPFVPCASCLSPAFDDAASPRHEVVAYLHRKKPGPLDLPPSIPVMINNVANAKTAVDFIASGDTVLTNSYHGVYWAQLLGRKVVCVPYSEKFMTYQYLPTMAGRSNWRDALPRAARTAPMLEEYRQINLAFAARVKEVWNAR